MRVFYLFVFEVLGWKWSGFGVEIVKRVFFAVFPVLIWFEKSRISIYLSDEVIDELEKRSIVKRSACYESLNRKALAGRLYDS